MHGGLGGGEWVERYGPCCPKWADDISRGSGDATAALAQADECRQPTTGCAKHTSQGPGNWACGTIIMMMKSLLNGQSLLGCGILAVAIPAAISIIWPEPAGRADRVVAEDLMEPSVRKWGVNHASPFGQGAPRPEAEPPALAEAAAQTQADEAATFKVDRHGRLVLGAQALASLDFIQNAIQQSSSDEEVAGIKSLALSGLVNSSFSEAAQMLENYQSYVIAERRLRYAGTNPEWSTEDLHRKVRELRRRHFGVAEAERLFREQEEQEWREIQTAGQQGDRS
jgi:hypothetical protein